MKYICNPINIEYKYQFIRFYGNTSISREAADPSLIRFKNKYYLFPSMAAGFFTSDNLADWEFHTLKDVPIYDYAPDVRVIGDYIYFSASNKYKNCSFFRSKDPINKEFEEIPGAFPFWDPNLFADEDGKIYFYWGCSNITPIYGVELDPKDMQPKGEPVELIFSNEKLHGFERCGENYIKTQSPEEVEAIINEHKKRNPELPEAILKAMRLHFSYLPYVEGSWMSKNKGKYYLQYACPGAQYNVYADGVYISNGPLGPFTLAQNNPYSYKPGGFIPGAGHGSTMEDEFGNLWHTSTMRISINHMFERRLGIWPAGYDNEGELFCNQRYGDWPQKLEKSKINPWENPQWMLLSYGKPAKASSFEIGYSPSRATDENIQTWWKAGSNVANEWLEIDLEQLCDVHAIQINFAEDKIATVIPEESMFHKSGSEMRYIDERKHYTRWLLEGSEDGINYFLIEDKSDVATDLAHDFIIIEAGIKARYLRCTIKELPYNQKACVSGLRVFGKGKGSLPEKIIISSIAFLSELDLLVKWKAIEVVGYNVLWGFSPEKLYHSCMVFDSNQMKIGALVKGQALYVRVDSFNENGITEGVVQKVTNCI